MLGRSLASDRRGAIAVLVAVGMTVLLGMSAFAIDLGAAYSQKARLQNVADSAALAGAIVWVKTGSAAQVKTTVQDVVVANTSTWGITITQSITNPTTSVPSVTVRLTAPSTLKLARVLTSATSVTTTGISVASVVPATVTACLVSLTTMQVNGTLSTGNCAMVANSSSSPAINVNSGGSVAASSIDTPGTIGYSGGTVSGTTNTGKSSDAAADPYSSFQSLEASAVSGCSYQNYTNQTTLTPGCWQNVSINTAVTLSPGTGGTPGIYVFNGMNFNSSGSITATGAGGVTIIDTTQMTLNGKISINAPITGNWAGMAIYAAGGLNFNSNVAYSINGALYSPTSTVIFGSGSFSTSACTYVVANSVIDNSNSTFTLPQSSCSSAYKSPSAPGGSKIALTQ